MIPYIAVYLPVLFSVITEKNRNIQVKHKQIILMFLVVLLTLFRGLRWETGTDWEQFLNVFHTIEFGDIIGFKRTQSTTLEPGYAFLNWICYYLTGSYTSLLILYNAIILFIFYKVSWYYLPKTPIYAFVMLIIFTNVFPLRQYFAAVIFLYSIRYILSKDILKYVFFVIIATSIHYTAIAMIPLYYIIDKDILYKKHSAFWLSIGYFLCIIISVSPLFSITLEIAGSIVASIMGMESTVVIRAMNYILKGEGEDGLKLTIIRSIFPMAKASVLMFFFYLCRKKVEDKKAYSLFFNCFVISTYMSTLFRFQMQDFIRIVYYFNFGIALLCALVIGILLPNNRRLFYYYLIIMFIYGVYGTFFITWPGLFIPYRSIFAI